MKRLTVVRSLLVAVFMEISRSHAVEILHWERLPLAVPLIVGQERVVFIDRDVRVGVPVEISEQLRVQSANGTIYLRAKTAIPSARLQLQDAETGALILLDITAQAAAINQAPLEPIRIVQPEPTGQRNSNTNAKTQTESADVSAESDAQPISRETPLPVVLTRYAAQNLYAPLRTIEPISGIVPVAVHTDLRLDTLMPSLSIRTTVLAAWRLDNFWVTAIRLTNITKQWVDLDPRLPQGDFVAATFQHSSMGPAGEPTDTTVLYLATHGHDLAASLFPAISPIDASLNVPTETVDDTVSNRHAQ